MGQTTVHAASRSSNAKFFLLSFLRCLFAGSALFLLRFEKKTVRDCQFFLNFAVWTKQWTAPIMTGSHLPNLPNLPTFSFFPLCVLFILLLLLYFSSFSLLLLPGIVVDQDQQIDDQVSTASSPGAFSALVRPPGLPAFAAAPWPENDMKMKIEMKMLEIKSGKSDSCYFMPFMELTEGSLEVKLPTIWTDEKQR